MNPEKHQAGCQRCHLGQLGHHHHCSLMETPPRACPQHVNEIVAGKTNRIDAQVKLYVPVAFYLGIPSDAKFSGAEFVTFCVVLKIFITALEV